MRFYGLLSLLLTAAVLIPASASAAPGTRVKAVKVYDRGSVRGDAFDVAIDVQQGMCGEDKDREPESFFDSLLTATIQNEGVTGVKVLRYWYRLPKKGAFPRLRSRKIAPSSSALIPGKESGDATFLFLKTLGGAKIPNGSTAEIPADYGFHSVTFFFQLKDGRGRRSTRRLRVGLAFGEYDRCD